MLNLEFGRLEVRCYNSRIDIATTHSWVMSQEVPKPHPFKAYYVLHFSFKFLFSCFRLNCLDSKCFNLLYLCCYVFVKIFASWMIHDFWCVNNLFIFFATTHNAHYVNCESWLINVSPWRKLFYWLGVWSLN